MWLRRKTITAGQLTSGMLISIGFKLYKVRSVQDAGTHVDCNLMSMDKSRKDSRLIGSLYLSKSDQIHVNIKK